MYLFLCRFLWVLQPSTDGYNAPVYSISRCLRLHTSAWFYVHTFDIITYLTSLLFMYLCNPKIWWINIFVLYIFSIGSKTFTVEDKNKLMNSVVSASIYFLQYWRKTLSKSYLILWFILIVRHNIVVEVSHTTLNALVLKSHLRCYKHLNIVLMKDI